MKLNCDLLNIKSTEFGIGRGNGDEREYVSVPVDITVQNALIKMVIATWSEMQITTHKMVEMCRPVMSHPKNTRAMNTSLWTHLNR